MQQIEEKVVNRLRQVTSAIKQHGANQESIITSTAERQAAVEFAKAAALRPQIVGVALQKISQDPEISKTMFEILETLNIIDGKAEITLVPRDQDVLGVILASWKAPPPSPPRKSKSGARKIVRGVRVCSWFRRQHVRTKLERTYFHGIDIRRMLQASTWLRTVTARARPQSPPSASRRRLGHGACSDRHAGSGRNHCGGFRVGFERCDCWRSYKSRSTRPVEEVRGGVLVRDAFEFD